MHSRVGTLKEKVFTACI